MKIMISTGDFEKEYNANGKIVNEIAQGFANKNIECKIVGYTCEKCLSGVSIENGIEVERIFIDEPVQPDDTFSKSIVKCKNRLQQVAFKVFFAVRHPVLTKQMFETTTKHQRKYAKMVAEISKKYRADKIICVYSPFKYTETVMKRADIPIEKFVYQLDPWGTNVILNENNLEKCRKEELMVFEKAKAIFTTPILYRIYKSDNQYSKYIDKMEVTEFPNIIWPNFGNETSAVDFEESAINIVYCGLISEYYRNPQIVLKALVKLIETGFNIRVYFFGVGKSNVLDAYAKRYPNNILIYGRINQFKARATMKKADILLNIGNSMDNQVPSKIFDYFSLGKPVLSTVKKSNCPSIEYLEKYPLGFILNENTEQNSQESLLEEFITGSKGKSLDFDVVKAIFANCTPEYVIEQIIKNLETCNVKQKNI